MKTINILLIVLSFSCICEGQTIEKFSIDSGGASTTAEGVELLYTIGEVNVQEYSTAEFSVSEGFINSSFRITIDPKVFLQGPILNPDTAGLMNDDLRSVSYIPTTSPYLDNATVNASVFSITGNNAIVDWVWIELRAANDTSKIINARSALLQRDGDVVDLDGVSNLIMNAAPKNYYVVVNHRNHLGAMSGNTINLIEGSVTTVDFTDSGFSTFGNFAQVQLLSNAMALWSGDANNSNAITFSGANNDVNAVKDYILVDPLNVLNFITFSSTGYLLEDVDLNGIGRFSGSPNDSNIIKDNVLNHPGNALSFPTYTISPTVPNSN